MMTLAIMLFLNISLLTLLGSDYDDDGGGGGDAHEIALLILQVKIQVKCTSMLKKHVHSE